MVRNKGSTLMYVAWNCRTRRRRRRHVGRPADLAAQTKYFCILSSEPFIFLAQLPVFESHLAAFVMTLSAAEIKRRCRQRHKKAGNDQTRDERHEKRQNTLDNPYCIHYNFTSQYFFTSLMFYGGFSISVSNRKFFRSTLSAAPENRKDFQVKL